MTVFLAFTPGPVGAEHLSGDPVCGDTVFLDTFDGENGGAPLAGSDGFTYTDWENFTVVSGSVDLIGDGYFDVYPGNGLYVDLAGDGHPPGVFATRGAVLQGLTSGTYQLSFHLGGSAHEPVSANDTVNVTVNDTSTTYLSESIVKQHDDPLADHNYTFDLPAATNLTITFANNGTDRAGAKLDAVELCRTGDFVPPLEELTGPCTFSQGFWKNHAARDRGKNSVASEWPVDNLTIGNVTYTEAELVEIFDKRVKGDASIVLAYQLIAAMLNRANGSLDQDANETHTVDDLIAEANALFETLEAGDAGGLLSGKDGYDVDADSALGQHMIEIAGLLKLYNTGVLTPGCNADVGVNKTAEQSTVAFDGTITWWINTTSNGPGAATDVNLTDELPGDGYTLGGPDAGDCAYDGRFVNCTYGNMDAGTHRLINASRPASVDDCGYVNNTATVSTTGVDNEDGNNASTASVYVTCADVGVTKEVQGIATGSVVPFEPVTFNINVTSNGPDDATNVNLTDPLDANYTWSLGGADAGDCSIAGQTLYCDWTTIPDGETRRINVTATSGIGVALENTATVTADVDTDAGNNTATAHYYFQGFD